MHDFVAHVLRKYYSQTDWNPFNSYLYLTNSSQAVLDFAVPHGLSLSISASPSPPFFTNYRLRALPSLTGALGYIFASIEDKEGNVKPLNLGGSSRDIRFKEFVDKFRIIESPRRPIGKEEIWQAGKRVDKRDYLLYGCMHIPSARVDALVTTRLSPTWQLLVTAISMAPRNPLGLSSQSSYSSNVNNERTNDGNNSVATAPPVISGPPPGSTNLHFNLQRDTGRWFTEYSYSVDDGLLGFRVLHNLGHVDISNPSSGNTGLSNSNGINGQPLNGEEQGRRQRVDEETGLESAVGGGLQGRFSVGAEVFFSPLEKSAGLSTGMRFTTLPENNIASASTSSPIGNPTSGLAANVSDGNDGNSSSSSSFNPSQPPTTITATLNPMMGHLSTAYAARMTRDIVACSRFDFNVYSYESELTLGAEYWLRSSTISNILNDTNITASILPQSEEKNILENNALTQTSERRLSSREQTGLSLRDGLSSFQGQRNPNMADGIWSLRERGSVHGDDEISSIPVASMTLSGKEEPNEGHAIPPPSTLSTSPAVATSDSPLISSSFLSQFRTLGVLKGRISTSGIAALLWEGKMRNCLVSFGIRGDLSSNELMGGGIGSGKPLRAVGIDVIYFS